MFRWRRKAHAPPSPRLARADAAANDAERQLQRVRQQEPTVREIVAELMTHRADNHIPERVARMIREGRHA